MIGFPKKLENTENDDNNKQPPFPPALTSASGVNSGQGDMQWESMQERRETELPGLSKSGFCSYLHFFV